MYSLVFLSFLLGATAVCLAAKDVETVAEVNERTTILSESAILATVAACTAGAVSIVLIPTMIYHKLIRKNMYDEVI